MKFFNKTLFGLEIKRSLKGLLVWSFSLAITMYLVIILFPMVKDMYAAIPEEFYDIMNSFGGLPDTIMEYFATEGAMMLQIFGALFAVLEGFNAIYKDEKEKTVESLYSLPYPRSTFYFTKLIKITFNIVVFSLINTLFCVIGFITVKESIDVGLFVIFSVLNTVMFLIIGYLGFVLACFLKSSSKNMIAIAIPFPFYIISVISFMTNNEWLKKLQYITPFTFSNPIEILKNDFSFEWISFVVFVGLTIVGLVVSYTLFKKREFIV
ncbi:MAG: ABC transporter permease [Firmicutes bacterium]|nr:ABC transporter permease [Bacillota bacterium]